MIKKSTLLLTFAALGLALLTLAGCAQIGAVSPLERRPATATLPPTLDPTRLALDTRESAPLATRAPTDTPTPPAPAVPSATPAPTDTLAPRPTATVWAGFQPAAPTVAPKATRVPAAPAALRPAPAPTRAAAPGLAGSLAFQLSSGGEIYVIRADGTGLHRLTVGLDPAWSPDSRQLAFARWGGDKPGLYVINADGSGERQVFGDAQIKEPAWSPDGARIVFTRQTGGKEGFDRCFPRFGCFHIGPDPFWRLAQVQVADGTLQDLPSDEHSHWPVWAGGKLLYAGDKGLKLRSPAAYDQTTLREEFWAAAPALSPDGRTVIYMVKLADHWDLFRMTIDGGERVQLTRSDPLGPHGANNVAPAWSPDGRHLAFLSDRDGAWRLYVMDPDGGNQQLLLPAQLAGLTFKYDFANERVVAWGP